MMWFKRDFNPSWLNNAGCVFGRQAVASDFRAELQQPFAQPRAFEPRVAGDEDSFAGERAVKELRRRGVEKLRRGGHLDCLACDRWSAFNWADKEATA